MQISQLRIGPHLPVTKETRGFRSEAGLNREECTARNEDGVHKSDDLLFSRQRQLVCSVRVQCKVVLWLKKNDKKATYVNIRIRVPKGSAEYCQCKNTKSTETFKLK